jgi:RNA polymerase sigma-70 factor (ECF subfamily)
MQAFKSIVEKYEKRVAGIIISMVGPCPEADDIGQETFIRFYKSMDNFRGDSSLSTYLGRIAINQSLNFLKKRKNRTHLEIDVEEVGKINSNEVSAIDDLADKELVQMALSQLELNFRSVITLRMIEGYSTKEAAEILNIPLGTVLSRLKRGQEKLREILLPLMK